MVLELNYPVIIDGGQATVFEDIGCDLKHKLWSARLITDDPNAIIETHKRYILAGAEIIATVSYQASIRGLIASGMTYEQAIATLQKTVALAREAIDQVLDEQPGITPPLVGASIGPFGAFLADGSEYRGKYEVSESELREFHLERIKILHESEADLLLFETFPDFTELNVIAEMLRKFSKPAWISFSCRNGAQLNDGTPIEKAAQLFNNHPSVFAIGVNCTAPKYISELLRRIKSTSDRRVVIYPNSGEVYDPANKNWSGTGDKDVFVRMSKQWLSEGADLLGGCCRIGPDHIQSIRNNFGRKDS